MRTIKFRGRRLDNGEWVYGNLMVIEDTYFIIEPVDFSYNNDTDATAFWFDSTEQEVDPATVGQYTGLKDKDGKEIYEGDIVKAESRRCALIKYKNGHFCIDYGDFICLISGEYYKVIGNIHDNPELLKTE